MAKVNGDTKKFKRKITVPQKPPFPAPKRKRITHGKSVDECVRSMPLGPLHTPLRRREEKKEEERSNSLLT